MNRGMKFDSAKDYYAILGVLPFAEDVVIKGAYRALAQRYHPDRFDGSADEATRRMVEINEAYQVLCAADLRQAYDEARMSLPAHQNRGVFDRRMQFEAEQFHPFAEKLQQWGYAAVAIREALVERGCRAEVADYLVDLITRN